MRPEEALQHSAKLDALRIGILDDLSAKLADAVISGLVIAFRPKTINDLDFEFAAHDLD